jgi:hypothetical protein
MGAAANIVINDGAGTPVSHTFTPIGKDENGVMWFEQTTPAPASPLGAKRIGFKQIRVYDARKQLTGNVRTIVSVKVPTLETLGSSDSGITPPPTLAYQEISRMEFTSAERSITQERKDTRVLSMNLLAEAQVVAALDALVNIW